MSGFKSGAVELRKKDTLSVSADASNLLISVDTQNRLYTVDEFGIYRYVSASGLATWNQLSGTPTTLSGYGISASDTLFDSKYLSTANLSAYLPLSGGTLSGPGNLNVSGSFQVYNVLFNDSSLNNLAFGYLAGNFNSSAYSTTNSNTFVGTNAGQFNTGSYNIFLGALAGKLNFNGGANTYIGYGAGEFSNGSNNTFLGNLAGSSNNTGSNNTYVGVNAGYYQTSSSYQLIIDAYPGRGSSNGELTNSLIVGNAAGSPSSQTLSLNANTTVSQNLNVSGTIAVANFLNSGIYSVNLGNLAGNSNLYNFTTNIGAHAGYYNTTSYNTNVGYESGFSNTIGQDNTNVGMYAGHNNISGSSNSCFGSEAGSHNLTGKNNSSFGYSAGYSNISGNNTTYLGNCAGFRQTGSNTIILDSYGDRGSSSNELLNSPIIVTNISSAASNQKISLNGNTIVSQNLNVSGIINGNSLAGSPGTNQYSIGYNQITFNRGASGYFSYGVDTSKAFIYNNGTTSTSLSIDGISNNITMYSNLNVSGNSSIVGTITASNFYTSNNVISIGSSNSILGTNNINIGTNAGYSLTTYSGANIFMGELAGNSTTSGSNNIFIGFQTGQLNTIGSGNTFMGRLAGLSNSTGNNNTYIGYQTGSNQTTASNLLILDSYGNRGTSSIEFTNSLIVGTAAYSPSSQLLSLNANTTISQNLNVSGVVQGKTNQWQFQTVPNGYHSGQTVNDCYLTDLSPYYVKSSCWVNNLWLPSSPSIGCSFCILNNHGDGNPGFASFANIGCATYPILSNYTDITAAGNTLSLGHDPTGINTTGASNTRFTWCVFDGAYWWVTYPGIF